MKRFTKTVLAGGAMLLCGAIAASAISLPRKAKVDLPPVTPPFLIEFSGGVEALDSMTIIDANEDGKTWSVMGMQARITYNSKLAMDDWMITRGLNLEAGKAYEFSITACNSNGTSYVEEFEVKLGTDTTIAAMTREVLPVSKVNSKTDMEFKSVFYVEQTGVYHLGIHGCSPKNKRTLYLDNIRVSAPMDGNLPAAVTDAAATPDAYGKKNAVVSFKAPTLNLVGAPLQNLEKIEVLCGNHTAHVFTAPAPGAELNFTDNVDAAGTYTYTIVPYTAAGKGTETTVSAFIGYTKPLSVSNVRITEGNEPGVVTVAWDAPLQDANGKNLTEDAVCYRLQDVSGNAPVMLADSLKANSFTYKALEPDAQSFKRYQVNAITEGGISAAVITDIQPVGKADALPWRESFANGSASRLIGYSLVSGNCSWTTFTDESHPSQDGDNGLMAMAATALGNAATLFTGKIDLAGTTNPTFTFYTWNFNSSGDDINQLKVEIASEGTTTTVVNNTVANLCDTVDCWNRIDVDLNAFKGKAVQIRITATAQRYGYTLVDAMRVYDKVDHNLTLTDLVAPPTVKTGESFEVLAHIFNNGYEPATGHTVTLLLNGEAVQSINAGQLLPEKADTIRFTHKFTPLDGAENNFSVRVDYAPDRIPSDNSGKTATVNHKVTTYPAPTNVTGHESRNNTVKLFWGAPVTDGVEADPVTDSFEDYTSFAKTNIGDWTLVDADKGTIGAPGNIVFPGVERGTTAAFFVLDSSLDGLNGSFASHSGTKCLANMYITSGDKKADDWLISPMLSGNAQTVTFWAKSYQQSYLETFEILYSTTGTELSDFQLLETKEKIIWPWTEYSFNLPKGARYFAIRCISTDCYMLMLDDFTYIPAGFADLEITGYNVYRDGKLVTPQPVATPEFIDTDVPLGNHTYHITALYKQGESAASTPFTLLTTSVTGVDSEAISIFAGNGFIGIEGGRGEQVRVTGISGGTLFSGTATESMRISATNGLYIVKVGNRTAKVLVK